MIDHLLGRPSVSWKRTQVLLVIIFWVWRIIKGGRRGPRILWLRRLNRILGRYSPWQIIVSSLTLLYTARHMDSLLGLAAPEPLARLYNRDYYRATWIATGLDAGFATAMSIRPKWLRDLCSMAFSVYYVIYANEAEEKLRRFRAVCTVEMLRATWEKTTNPYIRAVTWLHRPRVGVFRKILLQRPTGSKKSETKPILAWLFFDGTQQELSVCNELILDFPGGGFIAMTPAHHEERLRRWARNTGKAVVAIEYGKAPEYPYPWAIEECFAAYRAIVESKGRAVGMSGKEDVKVIMSGDSAGGNIVTNVMFKILEHPKFIPRPIALALSYPALDFNFTSWMTPENLRVVQHEHSSMDLPGLAEQKDHFTHISPLAVVDDKPKRSETNGNESLWDNLSRMLSSTGKSQDSNEGTGAISTRPSRPGSPAGTRRCRPQRTRTVIFGPSSGFSTTGESMEGEPSQHRARSEAATSRATSVDDLRIILEDAMNSEAELKKRMEQVQIVEKQEKSVYDSKKIPIGTRLTMTSRTGYFQDRIISPSMMRAMAILYIGPVRLPNFATDYYISPILAPATLLAQFPMTLINCGEKDPFVDDTVIFAGRLREAKRVRRSEVERALGVKVVREEGLDSDDPDSAARIEIFSETSTSGQHSESTSIPIPAKLSDRVKLLLETESDWVEMTIIEGWSHGYLQMLPLMHDVAKAIDSIGRWMNHEFERHATEKQAEASAATVAAVANGVESVTMGPGGSSEMEADKDEVLMFTPKKRKSPPSSFSKEEGLTSASLARRISEPVGRSDSSSEETLIGVVAAAKAVEAGLRSRSADNRKLRRPSETIARGISPLSPKPLIAVPIKGSVAASNAATRTGTPNGGGSAGEGAGGGNGGIFLTQGELMKRRRMEAVYGLVAVDRVADPVTPESEIGK